MPRLFRFLVRFIICVLVSGPVWSQTSAMPEPDHERLRELVKAGHLKQKLYAGKSAEAIAENFEPVIQEYEIRYRDGKTHVYSSEKPAEIRFYMLQAANAKPKLKVAVYPSIWASAYAEKASALIALGRLPEAATALDSAVALAPSNPHFLYARGQLYLKQKNWAEAQTTFVATEIAVQAFSSPEFKTNELTRALRGQSDALIEMGRLDEAEKISVRCLQLNKDDWAAKDQLRIIDILRDERDDPMTAQGDPVRRAFYAAWRRADGSVGSQLSYMRRHISGRTWNDNGVQRLAVLPEDKAIAECVTAFFPTPKKVRMVFEVDEKGMITAVHSDQKGWMADCVKEKLLGYKIRPPTSYPMDYCSRFEKTSDNTTEISNCGRQILVRACEQTGTSTHCTFQTREPHSADAASRSTFTFTQTEGPPKIITEQNGRVTNYRAEGSLASTQAVGCIPLTEARNTFTPPDLYRSVVECIAQKNYDLAASLFALAGIYGRFDAERVTDKSAGQAKTVLEMNTFSNVSQDKMSKLNEAINRVTKTPEFLGQLCGEVQKIGVPNYYPSYMILHGIKAFTGNPHEGALLKDFDSQKVWMNLQTVYLHCPA